MRNEKGFTLIEIVMVIILLGILAAVAIPRYFDLTDQARRAAVRGVAGGISGAMATNYAARSLTTANGVTVDNCNDAGSVTLGGVPSGYTVTAGAIASTAAVNCLVTTDGFGAYTARFVGLGIP